MSDHRHTLRIGRPVRADTRRTVRVLREQLGGAPVTRSQKKAVVAAVAATVTTPVVPTAPTGLYHIPPERAEAWKKWLKAQKALSKYADIITRENWDTSPPVDKLMTYIELIERQDELFLTAVNIIYDQLGIDPDSDNLEQNVFEKLATKPDKQAELKEYLSDVYQLITCNKPPAIGHKSTVLYTKQTRLLFMDPLSHILLRPHRVTNMLIKCTAEILKSLKKDPTLLTRVSAESADSQAMFADVYNTYIQQETLNATSKSLRDGFFLWQEVRAGIVPPDECAIFDTARCVEGSNTLLWENFCKYYNPLPQGTGENKYNALFSKVDNKLQVLNIMFSRVLVDIFKMYQTNTAANLREIYINMFTKVSTSKTVSQKSSYRPAIVNDLQTTAAGMMRMLDPEQYTFLFHLLYTLTKLEASEASEATEGSA